MLRAKNLVNKSSPSYKPDKVKSVPMVGERAFFIKKRITKHTVSTKTNRLRFKKKFKKSKVKKTNVFRFYGWSKRPKTKSLKFYRLRKKKDYLGLELKKLALT